MAFLLAKIAALLLLATFLGAWLQRWWTRRDHLDVTTEYQQLVTDWHAWRETVNEQLRQPTSVDFAPIEQRLVALERAVHGLYVPPPAAAVDLEPVLRKLSVLETHLQQAGHMGAGTTQPAVRVGSRNLLTHAAYGEPDDLKRIKGVAEVLEKMLHNIGVYYFWQIAEWTPEDIEHADAQLTAFKGRITRDDWVTQARQLARQLTRHRPPATAIAPLAG